MGVLAPVIGMAAAGGERGVTLMRGGGAEMRFATIQSAIDEAVAGDTVRLAPGIYHENVVFKRSGSADAPITLIGPGAIIDGADPELQRASNSRWTPRTEGGVTYHVAESPFAGRAFPGVNTWISRTSTPSEHGCDRLIATYASLQGLKDGPRGEGAYRDAFRVHVRLADGEDPNQVGLSVGQAEAVVDLDGFSHIRVQGVEVRNGGTSGIRLGGEGNYADQLISDVIVRNCWVGIASGGAGVASGVRISRVRILNGQPDAWEWHGGYIHGVGTYEKARFDGPYQGVGLDLKNLEDGEIAGCLILGQWDGMAVRGHRVRIHHNTIGYLIDDGIELESPSSSEIEFFNNHIYAAFTGISVTSNSPGPIYIYRNVVETTRTQTAMNPATKNNGFGIKSGHDWAGRAENVKFYHNTFYSNSYNVWEKLNDPAPNRWRGYDFVNNVFFSHSPKANVVFRGAGPEDDGGDNHWEANLYNIDMPHEEAALTERQLDAWFVQAAPEGRDLRLAEGAPGRNTASDYPARAGWPDTVEQFPSGRDRGAWEDDMRIDGIGAPEDVIGAKTPAFPNAAAAASVSVSRAR